MRYIYIYIYIYVYAKWYYFCRNVSVNARNYFGRKVSVNARKLKRWVILPFLNNIRMSPKIVHPRYFCWTSWLHQKFPLVILALLLCFLPSLFLLVALYLFFDFLKERRLKKLFCSHFPRINANQKFAPHFSLFCLKESARKLPWVFLLSPRVHTPKERKFSQLFSPFHSHGS